MHELIKNLSVLRMLNRLARQYHTPVLLFLGTILILVVQSNAVQLPEAIGSCSWRP